MQQRNLSLWYPADSFVTVTEKNTGEVGTYEGIVQMSGLGDGLDANRGDRRDR